MCLPCLDSTSSWSKRYHSMKTKRWRRTHTPLSFFSSKTFRCDSKLARIKILQTRYTGPSTGQLLKKSMVLLDVSSTKAEFSKLWLSSFPRLTAFWKISCQKMISVKLVSSLTPPKKVVNFSCTREANFFYTLKIWYAWAQSSTTSSWRARPSSI